MIRTAWVTYRRVPYFFTRTYEARQGANVRRPNRSRPRASCRSSRSKAEVLDLFHVRRVDPIWGTNIRAFGGRPNIHNTAIARCTADSLSPSATWCMSELGQGSPSGDIGAPTDGPPNSCRLARRIRRQGHKPSKFAYRVQGGCSRPAGETSTPEV